ncbi:scoloptoxin SSD14 [Drosophila navojoa]|nr:scoloptoxin SSD14 [Drosophila navojoa]
MLCNGLLTSQSMGIGGGLIMNIYHRESQQGYQIDAQAVAPYAAHQKMFDKDANASIIGPLSIAVPGEVMGYHLAHKRFGKLPWRTLVEPSLKICETGYRMSNHQASKVKMMWSYIKDNLQYQSVFLNEETGEHHQEGAMLKPPAKLCNTYKLLAENGPMDFYNGTVAKMLAEDLKELGSIITQDDLDTYTADLRLSVTMPLGNDTLYAVPPVSSGSVVAHILGILEGFNFTRADLADDEAYALTIHRITEALKFGFAHRPELGDPRFNDIRELVSQLTNPQYAAQQRAKINDNQVLGSPQDYGALLSSEEDPYGTSSFAVLAPNGDAVSVTSSINNYFGSSLIGPRTGIILNDCMNDFSVKENMFNLPQSQANTIDLHKRPMSSQSPMLLADRDGNIRLAIGAAGGTKIVGGIVEVAARFLWFGEDLKMAEDAPRFYNQLFPNVLQYEDGKFSENVLSLLRKRGHVLQPLSQKASSVVCAIGRNATAIYANADGRKQGGVGGF